MNRSLESFDLNRLLALYWLLEERSVTGAARRLNVSQPAMSRTLARLRADLGDPLLVQTGRSLSPTARADALRPQLGEAVALCRQVIRPQRDFDPAVSVTPFRIAGSDYLGHVALDAWTRKVAAKAPATTLEIHALTADIATRMAAGTIDIALIPDAALNAISAHVDPTRFVQRKVLTDRFVCAMRKDHPASKRRLTLARFAALDHILVSPSGDGPGMADEALAARKMSRRIAFRTPGFLLALSALGMTDAVALLPRLLARTAPGLALRDPPVPLPDLTILCVWHPARTTDPAHRWFRETLIAAIGNMTRN
jgi:DNA-binding transcriptional LysR family regulator